MGQYFLRKGLTYRDRAIVIDPGECLVLLKLTFGIRGQTFRAGMGIKVSPNSAAGTQSSQLASTDRRHHGQVHPLLPGKNSGNVGCSDTIT